MSTSEASKALHSCSSDTIVLPSVQEISVLHTDATHDDFHVIHGRTRLHSDGIRCNGTQTQPLFQGEYHTTHTVGNCLLHWCSHLHLDEDVSPKSSHEEGYQMVLFQVQRLSGSICLLCYWKSLIGMDIIKYHQIYWLSLKSYIGLDVGCIHPSIQTNKSKQTNEHTRANNGWMIGWIDAACIEV